MNDTIVILDFGGQYTQLIARRVRQLKVLSQVLPFGTGAEEIMALDPSGIILSGGPASVLEKNAPRCDPRVFSLGIPVLGICYGMQLMGVMLGGSAAPALKREYGLQDVRVDKGFALFRGLSSPQSCWMSHTYQVDKVPQGFWGGASTDTCPNAAMADEARKLYGLQFHPEVTHTQQGMAMLRAFLYDVCGCRGDWEMADFANHAVEEIKAAVGDGTVLLALSGGVDSSVVAALLYRAIGDRLHCVFVDHGFMRKDEPEMVKAVFGRNFPVSLTAVDAAGRFMAKLQGVEDPESKRKIIGAEFIAVFREEAAKLGPLDHFAQGTIYPDVIESGAVEGSTVIKSHHNVGGLPRELGFSSLIEPLRMLFKDEVRQLGLVLGLPQEMVMRQPFPGPGLAIRVMGSLTPEKVQLVRDSDAILREEIKLAGLDGDINQYFTVLSGVRSVGVMGDERSYDHAVAVRAVTTDDFMTADWARIPHEVLARISRRLVNEVPGINRVLFDITTKPPASIEWE